MDPNFSFPRLPAPTVRPPPPSRATVSPDGDNGPANRDSNALRASVLDVALQLGLGSNNTVANWMFNNSLEEEAEEDQSSPALTFGSTAPSDESNFSVRSPLTLPFPSATFNADKQHSSPDPTQVPPFIADYDRPIGVGITPSAAVSFPDIPVPPRPTTPSRGKLKKKRIDGYESDGGYVSESGKKKEAKNRAKEEKLQAKKDKEERKRAKSLFGSDKTSKKTLLEDKESAIGHATGYETDGSPVKTDSKPKSKKSKSKTPEETGDETDSGFVSSSSKGKSKTRFFKLGIKRSKPDLPQDPLPLPSPTVEREATPLPIASMFASSLPPPLSITPTPSTLRPPSLVESTQDRFPPSFLSATPSPIAPSTYLPSIVSAHSPQLRPPQVEALSSISTQRDSYGSAESDSLSPSSSNSHPKSRGPSSLGHDHAKRGQTVQPPITSPGSFSSLGQIPAPSMSISPTLSETMLAAISAPSSSHAPSAIPTAPRPVPSPLIPSFSPGQIFQLPPLSVSPTPSPNPSPQIPPRALSPSQSAVPVPHWAGTAFLYPQAPAPSPSKTTPSPSPGPAPRPRPRFPPTDGFGPRPATSPQSANANKKTAPFSGETQSTSDEARVRRSLTVDGQRQEMVRQTSHSQLRGAGTVTVQPRPGPPPQSQARAQAKEVAVAPLQLRIHPPTPQGMSYPVIPQSNQAVMPPSPLIVPSEDYIVPSPYGSPLPSPSPNVLAYYDIPPPSPPPVGPLPKPPPPPGSFNGVGVGGAVRERGLRRLSSLRNAVTGGGGEVEHGAGAGDVKQEQGLYSQPIPRGKRGKEAPFPHHPILPPELIGASGQAQGQGQGQGLTERVKVPRYRELYALALPESSEERERGERRRMMIAEANVRGDSRGPESDEEDEDEMRDVLARFEEARVGRDRYMEMGGGRALGRSHSFEAIQKMTGYDGDSGSDADGGENLDKDYYDESSHGHGEDREVGRKSISEEWGGDRNSRWSGSIYSRASFLDPDKSEETRERFLKRVEEMYWEDGREKGYAVPPVPKIPAAFAVGGKGASGDGRSWNRF